MVEIGLKSVGLLIVVALIAFALRNASAALRHRVWALGFVGLAALPLLCLRLPRLEIERPAIVPNVLRIEPPSPRLEIEMRSKPVEKAAPTVAGEAPTVSSVPLAEPWFDLWALGAGLALLRLGLMLFAAARLGQHGEDLPSDPGLGIPAHTRLRRAPRVDVPLTLGFLRPTILLPTASVEWTEERLRTILLHEGAHVRRGDWAWLVLSQALCALYWPNPLVWWAAARMRAAGELAADDAVLRAGVAAPRYAATLVDLAAEVRGRHAAALPIVERGTLKARVAAALRTARRSPLTRWGAVVALLLSGATVIPLAATRFIAASLTSQAGVVDLGADGRIEVVAITEVENGKSRSWDAGGAILTQPYLVDKGAMDWFSNTPVPSGMVARYVFVRAQLAGKATLPSFTDRPGGEILANHWYHNVSHWYHNVGDLYDIEDPQEAEYRIVRVVVPSGQSEGRMFARVATGAWTRFAEADFERGEIGRHSYPDAGLRLTPALPARPWKTELAFNLPDAFKERVARLVVTPGSGGFFMEGVSGTQTDNLETPIGDVRHVEILSRATRPLVLDHLPMAPRMGASPLPRNVVPPGTIDAKDGKARLPDGSTLAFEGVWDASDPKANGWTASGTPIAKPDPAAWAYGGRAVRFPSLRARHFILRRTGHKENVQSWVYDGDGLAAPTQNTWEEIADGRTTIGCGLLVGPRRPTVDLLFRLAPVPYRTVAEGTLGRTPGYRGFHRKGSYGERTFCVEFPRELLARMPGMDVSLVPLDKNGAEVKNAQGGTSSSRTTSDGGENVIEYALGPKEERRVRRLALKTRPWTWVRFAGIRLAPAR